VKAETGFRAKMSRGIEPPPLAVTVSACAVEAKRGVNPRQPQAAALPSVRSAFAISPSTALASPNTIKVLSAV